MKGFGKLMRVPVAAGLIITMLISSPISITSFANGTGTISISMIGKYDSADTASIRSIDTDTKEIRFRNHATGKTYTLTYDNTSMMYDARGTALSAQLLEVGQIVDVTFLKSSKHITTLNVSSEAWTIDSTKDHELVRNDGTARIKDDIYKINAKTLVLADGEPALAENVLSTDKIKVSGIGREIYSIVVTSGHGYVSLSSDTVEDQSLVGAWIELDNDVIHKISPNMLLSAPEGEYNLQIIGNGANYQSEVSISRNQETVVDTSEVTISKPKEGLVTFEIIPEDAEVFVDGKKVLTGVPQSVQYGYHNLKIMAEGYITQNRYLKVGTANSVVSIELEKDEDASSDSSSKSSSVNSATVSNSTEKASVGVNRADVNSSKSSSASTAATVSSNSSSSTTNQVISGYYIYFDAPYNAELYFDGSYFGTIPTRVEKISGSHEVILKMDGYQTKSYRIKIDTDKDDVTYQFPDMVKIESDSSSSSTTSSTSSDSSTNSSTGSSSSSDASSSASSGSSSSTDASSSASSGSSSSTDASSAASEDTSTTVDDTSSSSTEDSSASTGKTTNDTEEASDAASAASGEN